MLPEVKDAKKCRISKYNESFNQEDFNRISCAKCYELLEYVFHGQEFEFGMSEDGYLFSDNHEYIHPNLNQSIINSTMKHNEIDKWRKCCDAAKACCNDVMLKDSLVSNNTCSSIWDGWSCHSATLAGQISKVKCQSYITADSCNTILDHAYFQCNKNATWFSNEYGEWTDYQSCTSSTIAIKEQLINVNIICQSISLIFLVAGLMIIFSYKQLRVNRIKLHLHFFISLILHSLMQIIWESVIMRTNLTDLEKYVDSNHIGCIMTNLILQYTRNTNYFWMFSESLYLHTLLMTVFKEQTSLFIYYIIGWVLPFVSVFVYGLFAFFFNNQSCWTEDSYLKYIYIVPNILTIFLNIIFLINIIRVLYKKLTASNVNEPHQYRRAVRATLILVPLFGIHLILSPYIMCESTPGSIVFNTMNRIIESLQGFAVALIYCFFNGEVYELVKNSLISLKVFRKMRRKRDNVSMTFVTNAEGDFVDKNNQSRKESLIEKESLLFKNQIIN